MKMTYMSEQYAFAPADDELAQRMVRGAGVFLFLLMGVKAL